MEVTYQQQEEAARQEFQAQLLRLQGELQERKAREETLLRETYCSDMP